MANHWPIVQIREAAILIGRPETPITGQVYRQIGVRLWGQGAYEREPIDGGQTRYATLNRVEADDIIMNKIWARNGSVAVVSPDLSGCYGSSEFPTFAPIREKLHPRWFHWITKTSDFWQQCDEKSQGTSGKNRIRPEQFLSVEIPLPYLSEQQRIVARIEELVERVEEARGLRREAEISIRRMLLAAYARAIEGCDYKLMVEVAPLVRRPIKAEVDQQYLELGIRSFGKGTFHKPPVSGADLGSKRVFRIEPGDLIFSNVFAWEGAVAVAKPEDAGRVGSHRFITCLPRPGATTAKFLCFHFLAESGLEQLGDASPGGAGRNRTLGLEALGQIKAPVPDFEKQLWFDGLQAKVDELRRLQAQTQKELDALIPSILAKAFSGTL